MNEINVEIWSDVVCPWCYLGKRRFDTALARFAHRDSVTVTWRSFELDPSAPRTSAKTIPQRMRQDLGMSARQAATGVETITALAAEAGLEYRLDLAVPVNTFDVHRLLHFGAERGLGEPLRERLLRGYTGEGADLGSRETLVGLAVGAGLDAGEVAALLDGGEFGDAVRADEERARRLGVSGVPSFVVNGGVPWAGARSVPELRRMLEQAREPAGA